MRPLREKRNLNCKSRESGEVRIYAPRGSTAHIGEGLCHLGLNQRSRRAENLKSDSAGPNQRIRSLLEGAWKHERAKEERAER